jgi:hypothetical protein
MAPETDSVEWLDATDERVRWVGRPDLYPVAPFVAIAIGVGLVGVLLAAAVPSAVTRSGPIGFVLVGFFVGVGLFVLGWRLLQRRTTVYAITTDAVYEKTGFSSSRVSRVPLAAIESTSVDQSMLASVVDRGDVRIYAPATDRTTLALDGVSRPKEVRGLLTEPSESAESVETDRDAIDIDTGPETGETDAEDGLETGGEASEPLRAYVVDATDDAALLRAFLDDGTDDLKQGQAVSLFVRPGEEGPSPTRSEPSDVESPGENESPPDAGATDDRRYDRDGHSDEDKAEDGFVWDRQSNRNGW